MNRRDEETETNIEYVNIHDEINNYECYQYLRYEFEHGDDICYREITSRTYNNKITRLHSLQRYVERMTSLIRRQIGPDSGFKDLSYTNKINLVEDTHNNLMQQIYQMMMKNKQQEQH